VAGGVGAGPHLDARQGYGVRGRGSRRRRYECYGEAERGDCAPSIRHGPTYRTLNHRRNPARDTNNNARIECINQHPTSDSVKGDRREIAPTWIALVSTVARMSDKLGESICKMSDAK
jgi:hypothetical protein